MPTSAPRRGARREVILAEAARLFAERGYPATGIDDIGEAAGITGPGVYRHFGGKHEVLVEVVRSAVDGVVEGAAAAVEAHEDPWEALEALVDNMLEAVLDDRDGWAVVVREQRHLDRDAQRALAGGHRRHLDLWVGALTRARPDLDEPAARLVVQGVIGIVTPFALRPGAPPGRERAAELLRATALAVLRTGAGRAGSARGTRRAARSG